MVDCSKNAIAPFCLKYVGSFGRKYRERKVGFILRIFVSLDFGCFHSNLEWFSIKGLFEVRD